MSRIVFSVSVTGMAVSKVTVSVVKFSMFSVKVSVLDVNYESMRCKRLAVKQEKDCFDQMVNMYTVYLDL